MRTIATIRDIIRAIMFLVRLAKRAARALVFGARRARTARRAAMVGKTVLSGGR